MSTTCCSPPQAAAEGRRSVSLWLDVQGRGGLEFSFPTSSPWLSSPVPGEPMAGWPCALARPVIPLITFWLIPAELHWGERGSAASHGCAHPSAPQPPPGLGSVQQLPLHQQQDAGQRRCPHLPPRYGQQGSAAEGFGGVLLLLRHCKPAQHINQSTQVPLRWEHPKGPRTHPLTDEGEQKEVCLLQTALLAAQPSPQAWQGPSLSPPRAARQGLPLGSETLGVLGSPAHPCLPCLAHEVLASLPLQMMLYFNVYYFPVWCLAEGMMLQLKVPSRGARGRG